MPEVRFTTTRQASPSITICSAAAYPKVFVALGNNTQGVSAEVHYVEEQKRSLPHMEGNCQYCHLPMISKTWVPAAICPLSFGQGLWEQTRLPMLVLARTKPAQWQRKVVELPPSAMMLGTQLQRGMIFGLIRGKGREHKKVYYRIFTDFCEQCPEVFDVVPHLLKAWGHPNIPLTRT